MRVRDLQEHIALEDLDVTPIAQAITSDGLSRRQLLTTIGAGCIGACLPTRTPQAILAPLLRLIIGAGVRGGSRRAIPRVIRPRHYRPPASSRSQAIRRYGKRSAGAGAGIMSSAEVRAAVRAYDAYELINLAKFIESMDRQVWHDVQRYRPHAILINGLEQAQHQDLLNEISVTIAGLQNQAAISGNLEIHATDLRSRREDVLITRAVSFSGEGHTFVERRQVFPSNGPKLIQARVPGQETVSTELPVLIVDHKHIRLIRS